MLTDKAKKDFEKWLKTQPDFRLNNHTKAIIFKGCLSFDCFPEFFKETMFLIWFESIGFHIGRDSVQSWWIENSTYKQQQAEANDETFSNYDFFENIESQSEAIKKANELYNTANQ